MRVFKKFCLGTAGNMAITGAVAGGVLTIGVGAAIDGARMVGHANEIQTIADTAALAAMHPSDLKFHQREKIALAAVEQTMEQTPRAFELDDATVTLDQVRQTVEVDLTAKVPMIFGTLLGDDSRTVRGNAVAEEYTVSANAQNGGGLGRVSLSFVLDSSLSMDDELSKNRRLDAIRAAVNDVFGGARADNPTNPIEAAIYPFDWGMNDARMDTLQPGTQGLIDALAYLTTSEGSVPGEALEKAVEEQIAKRESSEVRNDTDPVRRVVIYITDGAVDAEKSDKDGKMLNDAQFFPTGAAATCKMPQTLEEAHDEVADELEKIAEDYEAGEPEGMPVYWPDGTLFDSDEDIRFDDELSVAENYALQQDMLAMASEVLFTRLAAVGANPIGGGAGGGGGPAVPGGPLTGIGPTISETLVNVGFGDPNGHYAHLQNDMRLLRSEVDLWKNTCRPTQEVRVLEACDKAQDKGIEIMAIDLSGEEASAAEIASSCVFDDQDTPADESENMPMPKMLGGAGMDQSMAYTTEDGSVYAVINDEASLRDILRTLLPDDLTMTADDKGGRSVRLIR